MPALPPADSSRADHHKVVIVGAGAAGIATASSLIARDPSLDIALIDPADVHYYQPGWTMVGAGVFKASSTAQTMAATLPRGVRAGRRLRSPGPIGAARGWSRCQL